MVPTKKNKKLGPTKKFNKFKVPTKKGQKFIPTNLKFQQKGT
jgi:hypothetical protein